MSANKPMQMTMVALGLLLFSVPASANVLLPVMFAGWLGVMYALIPVVIVEAIVLAVRWGFSDWEAILVSTSANVVSTVIGIPVAGIIAGCLQSQWIKNHSFSGFARRFHNISKQVFAAIFVVPFCLIGEERRTVEDQRILRWVEPLSIIVVLAFFFLCSWVVEGWVAGYFELPYGSSPSKVMLEANLVSYACLFAYTSKILIDYYRDSVEEVIESNVVSRGAEQAQTEAVEPTTEIDEDWWAA